MPVPRSSRASSAYDPSDPFAAIERAADVEADSIIVNDFMRRTGRDLRAQATDATEIPSGLLR